MQPRGLHICTAALAPHLLVPYGRGCLLLLGAGRTQFCCQSNPYCSKSCLFLAVSIQMRGIFAQFKESLFFPGHNHLARPLWDVPDISMPASPVPKAWLHLATHSLSLGSPLQIQTAPSLDGLSGARPKASAYFPLGALPIKPLLIREFKTACRITFVCS